MKIRLLMPVERDPEGQLTGVIFQEGQFRPGHRIRLSARADGLVSGDG